MPQGTLSIKDMFLNADPVVQAVMVILFLASLVCWVFILETSVLLRRFGRDIWLFNKILDQSSSEVPDPSDLPAPFEPVLDAGLTESEDGAGEESRADFRDRIERTMRQALAGRFRRFDGRIMFLATVGSTSPFIGLFGTVWGIMHSFIGIAASGETTLAVVAPGIAEALFATAMGLVAAIPAVISYNKITGHIKNLTQEAFLGISLAGNRLARLHFNLQRRERNE
jgi:biopolymer transport protein ExbB/TolQ